MIDAKRSEHDVSSQAEIGSIILREQALLEPGESIEIRFVDGAKWLGCFTLSRDIEQSDDDLTFLLKGYLFEGERSIQIPLTICDPDGRVRDEEENEYGNQTRAQFYADGPGWTADNAPKVKSVFYCATTRAGQKLAASSEKVEKEWQKGAAQVETDEGLKWFTAKDLLKAGPETGEWPRKMPLPVRSTSRDGTSTSGKAKPTRRRVKPGVHKRDQVTGETFPVLEAAL